MGGYGEVREKQNRALHFDARFWNFKPRGEILLHNLTREYSMDLIISSFPNTSRNCLR